MSLRPGDCAHAGVTLRSERCAAAVIRDATVVSLPGLSRDATRPAGADEMLGAIAAAAPGDIQAITIDLSRLLLDAVLHPAAGDRAAHQASHPGGISRVAVIRIVPRAARDPRLARSPAELVERLVARRFTVAGGHDLLGNELCPLDTAAVARVCTHLQRAGVRGVAIVAPGSQAQPEHERAVADAVQAALPDAHISAATDFGGQGLVAREATVILDCALGAITNRLLNVWQDAIRRTGTGAALRVARGDGGYTTPSRARALPALTLGASDALQLCGAAYLHGADECRVVLPRPGGHVSGDVRHGLAVVRPAELAGIGTALVVPTAVLAPDPGVSQNGERRWVRDLPVVHAPGDPDLLACVGAAVSQPTAWIDEVAFIESAEHLERIRREAEERVSAIVMANGAAPGTAYLTEASIVAVPYSPAGTVRIRVRVAGAADDGLRRARGGVNGAAQHDWAHGLRRAEAAAP